MSSFWKTLVENLFQILSGLFALAASVAGYLALRRDTKIKELENQIDRLKKTVLKTTSKVNPETDRLLIDDASFSIQILGINSLGPLHHCREELIQFLKKRKGVLHILLLDPKSHVFTQRSKLEADGVGRLSSERRTSAAIIKDIACISKHSHNIFLRVHDSEPTCALLVVDALQKDDSRWQMLINDYPRKSGTRGYEGGQFLVQYNVIRDRDSFDKRYSYFRDLWSRAKETSLEELSNI